MAINPLLKPCEIFILGEAPGESEAMFAHPFVGSSGVELANMLAEAGLCQYPTSSSPLVMQKFWAETGFAISNVFLDRPPQNKLEAWCGAKKETSDEYRKMLPHLQTEWPSYSWPSLYSFAPIKSGKYLNPKHLGALQRVALEIAACGPRIVLALGGTALWAITGSSAITSFRGTVLETKLGPKCLPTFHPAYVLRSWGDRPIVIADLFKLKNEAGFPEVRRPKREVWIEPALADIVEFKKKYLDQAEVMAYDIETAHGQITCIGFSPNPELAIVIPFVSRSTANYSYWASASEEISAWGLVRDILNLPAAKLAQNGLYDIQYLMGTVGLAPCNATEDTMLLHHALQPEMQKGLGFLGSIYTNEASWKIMRKRGKDEVEKADDE